MNIYSPSCPDLTLVDLPGITRIPIGDQPENIYDITKNMIYKYVCDPRTLILLVVAANQDLSVSEALKIAREDKVDKSG